MLDQNTSNLRSDCPVNFAVEILGDKWSLLIIRDIIFWGKKTYGDFLRSDEGIATNILASRLASLEKGGILSKATDAADKRKDVYRVTEKGLDLIPVLIEMVAWSAKNDRWQSMIRGGTLSQKRFVERAVKTKNKYSSIQQFKETIRNGGYLFEGVEQPKNPRKVKK
jgi:DNA-binding HxlR family transcriptional regulator